MSQRELAEGAIGVARRERHRLTSLPVLVLHAHTACNCKCVMCDIWKTTDARAFHPRDLEPQLASIRRLGVRWVVLSGGEPLMNRELPELCRMLRRESVRLTLLTTGLLLQRRAREVASSFDDVIVSIDGPEPIHDVIRRVPGAFRLIDAGVKAIRDISRDFRITARTTVQKVNFAHLRATVSAAKALDLNGISFLAVDLTSQAFNRPLVWPVERQSEVGLAASEVAKLEEEIRALLRENSTDISSEFIAESPEKLWRIVRHFRTHLGLEQPDAPVCNAPWTSAVVETDGTVRPCFFHPPIGSLADRDLETALNSETAIQFRSVLDIRTNPICQRCVCSLNHRS